MSTTAAPLCATCRLPGRYSVFQRGTGHRRSPGVRAAPGVQLETWPDRYFVLRDDGLATPIAVAGPIVEHQCAEELARLFSAEWRYLSPTCEWITVVGDALYAAPTDPATNRPRIGTESLRPRCFSDFAHAAHLVPKVVQEAYLEVLPHPPPRWRLHPTRPRSLLSLTETVVHFPATGDPVTPAEARSNMLAVLHDRPDQAGSPFPWRASAQRYSGTVDWVILDARNHVVVQCGRGDTGKESAAAILPTVVA